jgi:transcriptional regulator with XRE-family HTH domain
VPDGDSQDSDLQTVGKLSLESAALLGARLTQLRKLSGVKVDDLADFLDLSPASTYALLAGDRDPRLGELIRAAYLFGVRSIEELIAPLGSEQIMRNEFGPIPIARRDPPGAG